MPVPRSTKRAATGSRRGRWLRCTALGFTVDTSVNPHMNYTARAAVPTFASSTPRPLLGCATSCSRSRARPASPGPRVGLGSRLHRDRARARRRSLRAVGILARLGVTNRIMLSPEGSTLDEMKAVTRALIAARSSHVHLDVPQPVGRPGHTPVRAIAGRPRPVSPGDRAVLRVFLRRAGRTYDHAARVQAGLAAATERH